MQYRATQWSTKQYKVEDNRHTLVRDGLTQIPCQHVLMWQRTYSPQIISEYEGSGYTILERCSVGDYLIIRILVQRDKRM